MKNCAAALPSHSIATGQKPNKNSIKMEMKAATYGGEQAERSGRDQVQRRVDQFVLLADVDHDALAGRRRQPAPLHHRRRVHGRHGGHVGRQVHSHGQHLLALVILTVEALQVHRVHLQQTNRSMTFQLQTINRPQNHSLFLFLRHRPLKAELALATNPVSQKDESCKFHLYHLFAGFMPYDQTRTTFFSC